jgi:hypothetical protein
MKKLKLHSILILTAILLCSIHENSFSQGFYPGKGSVQLDFGTGAYSWGVPIYVGLDFGVSDVITIGPRASFSSYYGYNNSVINLLFRGDYHYSYHIDALPDELDLYGGISAGYSIWNASSGDLYRRSTGVVHIQAGARWYFSDKWAANAEVLAGNLSGLSVGMTYRFK